MLRLPEFSLERPKTIKEAIALLAEHGDKAMPIAGGTDLLPNMKHGLFEPKILVSLAEIDDYAATEKMVDEYEGSDYLNSPEFHEMLHDSEKV